LGLRIVLFFLLAAVGMMGVSLVVPSDLPYGTLPVLVGSLLGGWALLGLDGRGPGALGFHLSREAAKEALLGLVLGVAVGGIVIVGLVGSGVLRWGAEAGGVAEYVSEGGASLWLFTLPAAGEEALMRGYLFQALAEAWGGGWALWTTSILFGALHLGNPNTSWIGLANIAVAGLFLGAVYLRTASLWWASGAHLGWNWTHGFLADLPVSGLDVVDAPYLEAVASGPPWLSGGSFGPEGSVLATAVLGVAAVVIWNASWLRPGREALKTRPLFLLGEPSPPREAGTWQIR
jgi:membrane protease YdiL (CAAX protease family)